MICAIDKNSVAIELDNILLFICQIQTYVNLIELKTHGMDLKGPEFYLAFC